MGRGHQEHLWDLKLGKVFRLDTKGSIRKRTIDDLDMTESFSSARDHVKWTESQAKDWEEIFANHLRIKD